MTGRERADPHDRCAVHQPLARGPTLARRVAHPPRWRAARQRRQGLDDEKRALDHESVGRIRCQIAVALAERHARPPLPHGEPYQHRMGPLIPTIFFAARAAAPPDAGGVADRGVELPARQRGLGIGVGPRVSVRDAFLATLARWVKTSKADRDAITAVRPRLFEPVLDALARELQIGAWLPPGLSKPAPRATMRGTATHRSRPC